MIFSSTLFQHTHIKVNYKTLSFLSTSTLALIEILFLSFIYFHTWPVIFYLVLITITFFIGTHQYLKIIYFWFEKHLMVNLRKNSEIPPKYEELGPWNSYLAEVNVGSQVPFLGKTIAENKIRQQFGINIVLIQHRQNIIFAPTGNDVISPHDKLVILGEEEQIEDFRKALEKIDAPQDSLKLLENVVLKKFLIEKNMQYSGKTIRESKIREKIRGMVVGFERKGMRILNPDPDIKLKVGDVLYLTGEIKYLQTTNDK
jgi:CPA2 family monovalent cation:H+ antiporter-2